MTPARRATALGTAEIRKLVATCDVSLASQRDRALLLPGFAAALRRSELVAVQREHLTFSRRTYACCPLRQGCR